jgi:hypothetical protein
MRFASSSAAGGENVRVFVYSIRGVREFAIVLGSKVGGGAAMWGPDGTV